MIAPLDSFSSSLEKEIHHIFSEQGVMASAKNFEFRPQQQEMAAAVARALENRTHLLVEAGTGVGKSLAYLMPSILFAGQHSRKAVISTHTINLQEQLFYKDIPIVQKLVDEEFTATLLKGRQNYLCPRRLERAMAQPAELFVSAEAAELKRIWEWSLQTKDGTLSDFDTPPDYKVWSHVCSEPHQCTPRTCGNDPRCFYQQARKRAEDARVLVINHSLFFNFLAGAEDDADKEERGFLFANDFVVFDEAHTLENVAARHLGLDLSHGGIRRLLHRLYNPKSQKGLLQILRQGALVQQVTNVEEECEAFFAGLEQRLTFGRAKELRVTRPDLVENSLNTPLAQLYRALADIARETKDDYIKAEVQDSARRVESLRVGLGQFLSQTREDHVYWAERSDRGAGTLQLCAAPVEVAAQLRTLLFRPDETVIMTSATLAAGRGLGYFQNRIGGEAADSLQVDSPFDYPNQMKVYIPKTMPEPASKQPYEDALAHWIKYFTKLTKGRAFVLFTSYQSLKNLSATLEMFFTTSGMTFLAQGGSMPRHRMLEKFKTGKNCVLFGTDSFWQGVDVPGEALSNVILTRLPFAVPDHPLIEAKLERITARGGDAFREYSLPEAILKFRQGIGRLIRTKQDKGIIVILDNRILTKTYGKAFMAMLPDCPVEIIETD
ncbi:MAG: ATP-dependent helicase [Verrucomicrobia bacterium Tous-C9LFEB]|nr:MAG: ATP-dependent helicase [Verrucomicrobia bacterium Tous-C9LFEB]